MSKIKLSTGKQGYAVELDLYHRNKHILYYVLETAYAMNMNEYLEKAWMLDSSMDMLIIDKGRLTLMPVTPSVVYIKVGPTDTHPSLKVQHHLLIESKLFDLSRLVTISDKEGQIFTADKRSPLYNTTVKMGVGVVDSDPQIQYSEDGENWGPIRFSDAKFFRIREEDAECWGIPRKLHDDCFSCLDKHRDNWNNTSCYCPECGRKVV